MNRRQFLAAGVGLASLALSGCQGARESSTTATTRRAGASRRTTAEPEREDLWIRNEDSDSKTVRLSVYRGSESRDAVVDSYYEVPDDVILRFPDLLRHGTSYRFEVVPLQAEPSTKTLTARGCGERSEAPEGEHPVVVDVTESEPSITFKPCDVSFATAFADASDYEVEKPAAAGGAPDEATTEAA